MKNFLLILVAIVLLVIFGTLGFLYSLFTSKDHNKYFRAIAESLDQFGNVVCQDLFNQWMIRNVKPGAYYTGERYKFGNIDETVSSVLGKNKKWGTLTKSGRWLDRLLNRFDKNHSIDAIEENP